MVVKYKVFNVSLLQTGANFHNAKMPELILLLTFFVVLFLLTIL